MKKSSITWLCVVLAFIPGLIAVIYIALGVGVSAWQWLFTIDLPAFLWLGLTLVHYRHNRTKSAAWLFALFPVAFFEPALGACLWISSIHSGR